MTEKRFELKWRDTGEVLYDNETGLEHKIYSPDYRFHVRDMMNELAEENQYLRELLDIGRTNAKDIVDVLNIQQKDNNELRQHIKKLEKQIYLIHMSSMFSTVKFFKGDVSKRYYYSEKTDRLYDTANNYGQYDKILEKKEIAMLLNEYETLLKERDENEH